MTGKWTWRHAAILLIALGYVVLFWHRLILSNLVPFHFDTLAFYFPNWATGKTLLQQGHLLWDPFRNLGQPFLAVPANQALYPSRFLGLLLDYVPYARFNILSHVLLATVFGYLLGQSSSRSVVGGIVSALGFGFGGILFLRVVFPADFSVVAWFPVVWYFLSQKRSLALGVSLALQWLAGYPPLFLVSLAGLALVAVLDENPWRSLLCLGKGCLLALGLTAVHWVPFLELLRESIRTVVLDPATASINSAHPIFLLKALFFPGAVGLFSLNDNFYRATFFCGPLIAALFLLAMIKGGRRERGLGLIALLALLLSLGSSLPFYSKLSFLRIFRYPGNWLMVASGALVFGAASGVVFLRDRRVQIAMVILVAVDLLCFAWPVRHPWGDANFFRPPAFVLKGISLENRPSRVLFDEAILEHYSSWDYEKIESWRVFMAGLLPSYGTAFGLHEVGSHHNLTSRRVRDFRRRLLESRLNQTLLNEACIDSLVLLKTSVPRGGIPKPQDFQVIKNQSSYARAFLADSPQAVSILTDKPGDVELSASGPGRLVVSESFFPGWIVTVDGVRQPVVAYNETFLSVDLAGGDHRIKFDYRPLSFRLGFAITLLTLLGGGAIAIRRRKKARIPGPAGF